MALNIHSLKPIYPISEVSRTALMFPGNSQELIYLIPVSRSYLTTDILLCNWPWESKHIRQARRFARETGGEFSRNGKTATVDIYKTSTYYNVIGGYVEAVYPNGHPENGLTLSDKNNIGLIRFEEGGDLKLARVKKHLLKIEESVLSMNQN